MAHADTADTGGRTRATPVQEARATAPVDASQVDATTAAVRSPWRAVAIPSEHGGWGLTAEPILLGLVVAFSWAGLAIGLAAMLSFLVRTPLKLAVVDHRRGRNLERTGLARRLAATELALIAVFAAAALVLAGPVWLIPVAVAAPLIGVELWYDVRSRGRRLIPELAGSVGIASVAAAIIIADDAAVSLAVGVWLILAARAIASIPFIRTQIARLRRGSAPLRLTDTFQAVGVASAVVAVLFVEPRVLAGATVVVVGIGVQFIALRLRHVPPAKVNGILQMVYGLAVVAATALGVLLT